MSTYLFSVGIKRYYFNILFILAYFLLKISTRLHIEMYETKKKKKSKVNNMAKYHVDNVR